MNKNCGKIELENKITVKERKL